MPSYFCHSCGSLNPLGVKRCNNCNSLLQVPEYVLNDFQNEISALREDFEKRIKNLEDRLYAYEEQNQLREEALQQEQVQESAEDAVAEKLAFETPVPIPAEADDITAKVFEKPESEVQKEFSQEVPQPVAVIETRSKEKKQVHKTEPAKLKPPRKTAKERLAEMPFLAGLLEEVGTPFINLWEFGKKSYNTYKEKNQLPVFFMTLAGIGALLFGFGYLMQLSVGYFGKLSELVKISFGFACSFGIAIWAIKLNRKDAKFRDFSSALLGLFISLNYLFIYFLSDVGGTYPMLQSPITGFALIAVNTALAIFLALRYETKIVAILSLLGGAFTPFYLNTSDSSASYFVYLWILCVASIIVSRKIKWKSLASISFITATSIIQMAVLSDINAYSLIVYTIIFHAFAYLFNWVSLFDGVKMQENLSKNSIILLAGNISIFLFNLFYLYHDAGYYNWLGYVFLANALPFFPILWFMNKNASRNMKLLLCIVAGTFIAFAIPALFNTELMGLFWSIEALALIYLGYNFNHASIRKEGYLLLLVALGKIALTFNDLYFADGPDQLFTSGYLNLLILGAVISSALVLAHKYQHLHFPFEEKLTTFLKAVLPIWFVCASAITILWYTSFWFAFFFSVPVFALFIASMRFKNTFTYYVALTAFIYTIVHAAIASIISFFDNSSSILGAGSANLLFIGGFTFALWLLTSKNLGDEADGTRHKPLRRLENFLSVWFTAVFILAAFHYADVYAFNLAIAPMFLLIYVGYKRKLLLTEFIGILYGLFIFSGFLVSANEADSLRFSQQLLYGKIAVIETGAIMWFLKLFYGKFLKGNSRIETMDVVREIFYWIVPLVILSPIRRFSPELLGTGIWVSALLSFILHELTKRKSLLAELYIISAVGVAFSLITDYYLYAIPAAAVVLSIIFIAKKGYLFSLYPKSLYTAMFVGMPYYLSLCVSIVLWRYFNLTTASFYVFSSIMMLLLFFRKNIAPLFNSQPYAFWFALMSLTIGVGLAAQTNELLEKLSAIIPLSLLGIMLFSKFSLYGKTQKAQQVASFIWFHMLILLSYAFILTHSALTVAFIAHAIAVLFNSMKSHMKPLVWQSIAFFAFAIIKLYVYDISHFSMGQKVVVFVIIGALLLGASYLYMKVKDRFEDEKAE